MVYFQTLYKYVPDTIELNFPVVLLESAIIKDTVDDKILLRNTFENNGEQNIIAIAISINAKDVFGNDIDFNSESSLEYIYQDMVFEPHSKFGNKIAIDLPENARKVEIEIKSIVLGNGEIISSNSENIVNIPKKQDLKCHREYLAMFDDNNILPQFYYSESSNAWRCTCGEINKISDASCKKCNRTNDFVKRTFTEENIAKKISDLKQETQKPNLANAKDNNMILQSQEENDNNIILADANDHRRTKKSKAIKITVFIALIVILCVVISIFYNSSKPNITAMITVSKVNIQPYINVIGQEMYNGAIDLDIDTYNGMDNVDFMGVEGTISWSAVEGSGDTIAVMDWVANSSMTEKEYNQYINWLNDYFESEYLERYFSNITDEKCYLWVDEYNNCAVVCWKEDGIIHLLWELLEF